MFHEHGNKVGCVSTILNRARLRFMKHVKCVFHKKLIFEVYGFYKKTNSIEKVKKQACHYSCYLRNKNAKLFDSSLHYYFQLTAVFYILCGVKSEQNHKITLLFTQPINISSNHLLIWVIDAHHCSMTPKNRSLPTNFASRVV